MSRSCIPVSYCIEPDRLSYHITPLVWYWSICQQPHSTHMHSLTPRKSYSHPKGSSRASRLVQVASHVYTYLIICRASHRTVWRSQNSYSILGDLARFSTSPQATRPYLARITCAACSRVRHVRPAGLKFSSGRLCANFGSAQSSCESHHLCLFPSRNNDRIVGFYRYGLVKDSQPNQIRPASSPNVEYGVMFTNHSCNSGDRVPIQGLYISHEKKLPGSHSCGERCECIDWAKGRNPLDAQVEEHRSRHSQEQGM